MMRRAVQCFICPEYTYTRWPWLWSPKTTGFRRPIVISPKTVVLSRIVGGNSKTTENGVSGCCGIVPHSSSIIPWYPAIERWIRKYNQTVRPTPPDVPQALVSPSLKIIAGSETAPNFQWGAVSLPTKGARTFLFQQILYGAKYLKPQIFPVGRKQ